jgi:DNA-binding NarL/FixJ family response regulator
MRVIICDDQALIREGLEMILKLDANIEVVGLAQDGAEAVELAEEKKPDLVLMDLKMPGMNGVEATRRIHLNYPDIKILILTTYDDDSWLFDAIRAGASGYLLKDTPREDVIKAIKGTSEGRTYLDPTVAGKLLSQFADHQTQPSSLITDKLTEREADVLRLLARGLSNNDIAERLALSEGTVRNYISTILAKLGLSDRTQAAIVAIQHGLVS